MASRADYLLKYMSKDDTKKHRKKSRRSKDAKEEARILIEGLGDFMRSSKPSEPAPTDGRDFLKLALPEPRSEFDPTSVELNHSTVPLKVFKRIDNGELIKTHNLAIYEKKVEEKPDTIYRDLSGMIIDLQLKRAEIKALKYSEIENSTLQTERINTGDMDRKKREADEEQLSRATRFDVSKTDSEYINHMTQKQVFDDPMAGGLNVPPTAQAELHSMTSRPVYSASLQPINRFNIKAGHFWDGIDRGTGFEERLVRARDLSYVKKVTDRAERESYTEYDFD